MRRAFIAAMVVVVVASLVFLGGCGERGVWVCVKEIRHSNVINADGRQGAEDQNLDEGSGDRLFTTEYELDEEGNTVRTITTSEFGEKSELVHDHDEYGNVVSTTIVKLNDIVQSSNTDDKDFSIETDSMGRATKRTFSSKSPDEEGRYFEVVETSQYGDTGRLAEFQRERRITGLVIEDSWLEQRYDEKGYLVEFTDSSSQEPTDELRQAWRDGTSYYVYDMCYEKGCKLAIDMRYDQRGYPESATLSCRTSRQLMESNGYGQDESPDVNEWALEYRLDTDEHGNVTKIFNEDGQLMYECEYAFIEHPSVACRAQGYQLPYWISY